jgi:hypothetical protein
VVVAGFAVAARCRARRIVSSLPRAAVLFAGLAVPPPQFGGVSVLSPEQQLRAIAGLAGVSQIQLPAIAPQAYEASVSSSNSSDSSLPSAFNPSSLGLLTMQKPSPAVTTSLDNTLLADAGQSAAAGGPVPATGGRAPRGGINAACSSSPLTARLQTGGAFWTAQGVSAAPIGFPPGVFTGSVAANANPLALGPGGDRSNLPSPGPAGDWCRPPPVPFARSSPLASRIFWTPVAVVLAGIVVFWLSRGVKTPI